MGQINSLIVGTVRLYSTEKRQGIAINGGHKFRFKIKDDSIKNIKVDDAIAFHVHGRQFEALFNIKEKSSIGDIVNAFVRHNKIIFHKPGSPKHKHGVIKSLESTKITIEETDTNSLRNIHKIYVNNLDFELVHELGIGGKLIFTEIFGLIINSVEVDHDVN